MATYKNERDNTMKKQMCLVALCFFSLSGAAMADEVWTSNYGKVVYETDLGPTAIWSYRNENYNGLIHLAGLAGIYKNRGSYEGYWVQYSSDKRCDTVRPTQNKDTSHYWGRFHITFIDKDFPSRWEAKWGYCNDDMQPTPWRAEPYFGQ